MRYLFPFLILFLCFSLSGQDESFRASYGRGSVFGNEFVAGVERIDDGYVVAGQREESVTGSDVILWRFSNAYTLVDSIVYTLPGSQVAGETYTGPDGGFLFAWTDFSENPDAVQLTYFNSDFSERWHNEIPGHRFYADIDALFFKSADEMVISLANTQRRTALLNYSSAEGITDTIYDGDTDKVRLLSIEPAVEDGYLVAGSIDAPIAGGGTSSFVGLLGADGDFSWQHVYSFAIGASGEFTQRSRYYIGVHRVAGENLLISSSGNSGGRWIQRMDTLGNRISETYLPMAFNGQGEVMHLVSAEQIYMAAEDAGGGYLISTEDYIPTGDFEYLGEDTRGAGNLFFPEENLFLFAHGVSSGPSDFDGRLVIQNLMTGESETTIFGRKNINAQDYALGLLPTDDGGFRLITAMPDTSEIELPTMLTVDRFGQELGRRVLINQEVNMNAAGMAYSSAESGDFYLTMLTRTMGFQLAKFTPSGDTLWTSSLPVGSTPSATRIAELQDGNLLAMDSEYNPSTVAQFPLIIRVLNEFGEQMSSFKSTNISLKTRQQLVAAPDSIIYVAGSDSRFRSGYIEAFSYASNSLLWSSPVTTPGYSLHYATNPIIHPDGRIGALLWGSSSSSESPSPQVLSYVLYDREGNEEQRMILAQAKAISDVRAVPHSTDSLSIFFSQEYHTGVDSGRQAVTFMKLSYESMELGNKLRVLSPFGYPRAADVKYLLEGRTAVLFTARGSNASFSNDVILVVVNSDGSITDIQNPTGPELNLRVYPNPFISEITVEQLDGNDLTGSTYQIVSSAGRVVLNGRITGARQTINVHNLAVGTYFMVIRTEGSGTTVKQVIKR